MSRKMFEYDGDYPISGENDRCKNMAMVGRKAVKGEASLSGTVCTIKKNTVIFLNGFTVVFESDEEFDLNGDLNLWLSVSEVPVEGAVSYTHDIYTHEEDEAYSPGDNHYMFYKFGSGFKGEILTLPSVKAEVDKIKKQNILWSGIQWPVDSQTATFKETVQSQAKGIVLVFSRYDTANNAALDDNFVEFFVSKQLVAEKPGKGHVFMMTSANFSGVAFKYIYINNDKLTGHDTNTNSGTASGITYNNKTFCLRYVIGV